MLTDREYNVFHRKVTQRLSARGYEKSTAFYMSPQHSRDDPFGQSTVFGANGELQGTRRGVAFRSAKPVPFDMMVDAILTFGVLPELDSFSRPQFEPFDPDTFKVPEKVILDNGKTVAPRVTPADVEAAIVDETYTILPSGRVTVCELTLVNGFTVRGESAVVFIENFDTSIGERIARQNAVNQVWPLLGYALREKAHAEERDFATGFAGAPA